MSNIKSLEEKVWAAARKEAEARGKRLVERVQEALKDELPEFPVCGTMVGNKSYQAPEMSHGEKQDIAHHFLNDIQIAAEIALVGKIFDRMADKLVSGASK
jgi:ribosomal protein S7